MSMNAEASPYIVVIPALDPGQALLAYTRSLVQEGFLLVVINDGSSKAHEAVFESIAAQAACVVLKHAENRGKGAALKTAYAYIQANYPSARVIITCDSDGQHTLSDVVRMKEGTAEDGGILLGTRDFSKTHVPPKSRFGNRLTSAVFRLLFGLKCTDTQTGLRAFPASLLQWMQEVSGDRFEYEMNVLIQAAQSGLPIASIPIATVYEMGNAGTHFRPMLDGLRIYRVIFANFFMFISTSALSAGIDIAIYMVLFTVFNHFQLSPDILRIALAKGIARGVSAIANFAMNKQFVFKIKSGSRGALKRYAVLCVGILALSIGFVSLFTSVFRLDERLTSPFVDIALFMLSYRVQRGWVFKEDSK